MKNFTVNFNDLSNLLNIFCENGFVIIEDVFNYNEINEIKNEIFNIIKLFYPINHPKITFSTNNDSKVLIYL